MALVRFVLMIVLSQIVAGERVPATANENSNQRLLDRPEVMLRMAATLEVRSSHVSTASRAKGQSHSQLPQQCTVAEELATRARESPGLWTALPLAEALRQYSIAKDCWGAAGDRRAEAETLQTIGEIQYRSSDYKNAISSYDKALALWRELQDAMAEAHTRNEQGLAYIDWNKASKSAPLCDEARSRSRELGDKVGEANALYCLGWGSYRVGNLERAAENLNQALALLQDAPNQSAQARILFGIGCVSTDKGDAGKASENFQKSLAVWQSINDPWWQGKTLAAMTRIYTLNGDNQKAIDTTNQKVLPLFREIGYRFGQAVALNNIAYTFETLGNVPSACDYYSQAVTIFREIGDRKAEAITLRYLGHAYYILGDKEQTRTFYEESLALLKSLDRADRNRLVEADLYNSLGLVYFSAGKEQEALQQFWRAYHAFDEQQNGRGLVYTLNYIGYCFAGAGNTQAAVNYYRRALKVAASAADHQANVLTLYNLANAERGLGELTAARSHIKESITAIESSRTKVVSQDLRSSYIATVHQQYELYIDILMQLDKRRPSEGLAVAALEVSERGRARSLLETIGEARADIRRGVDAALLARETTLQKQMDEKAASRAKLLSGSHTDRQAQTLEEEIRKLAADYAEVEAQIRASSPRYAALTQPQPLSLNEIEQQVLDDESLLLEYALGDERSYVWVVSRTEVSTFELPGRAKIEEGASRFHKLLTANQPVPGETFAQLQDRVREASTHIPEEAASFSKLLLGPVMTKLARKRLIIVPDGALQYIPFQALVVPGTANDKDATAQSNTSVGSEELVPLMVDHEIVNEASASALALVLKETTQRQQAPNTIAVLANPVFEADDPRIKSKSSSETKTVRLPQDAQVRGVLGDAGFGEGLRIPSLPASREEANAIMAVVPWRTGFKAEGFEASRATITRPELAQYRIVHFATHGFVDYQHPELSGLVLSLFDEQGNPQNGFLRLHDIYNLKLSADLVVLSACNTGLGKDVKGEGLIGLTRGFMYAGAGGVVASLWKVDDDATAELMTHFYEGMFKRGLTPAAALREAQLAMWRQKRWHAPYFWAAFVIQGQYNQHLNSGSRLTPAVRVAALGVLISGLSLGVFFLLRRRRRRIL